MKAINATTARANLFKIMALVNENSQPITLTNAKGKNAVLRTVKIIRMWTHYYGVR